MVKSHIFLNNPVSKAFSLAEVLLTTVIIGIVASTIIPVLIADTQQAEYKIALKKQVSVVSQAINRVLQDNGGTIVNIGGLSTLAGGNTFMIVADKIPPATNALGNQLAQYLSVNKKCLMISVFSSNDLNCFPNPTGKKLNGTAYSYSSYYSMQLNDGAQISVYYLYSECTSNSAIPCGEIMIDINGNQKRPNQIGKDIYHFRMNANNIKPYGTTGDTYDVGRITNHYGCDLTVDPQAIGYTCAADFLK